MIHRIRRARGWSMLATCLMIVLNEASWEIFREQEPLGCTSSTPSWLQELTEGQNPLDRQRKRWERAAAFAGVPQACSRLAVLRNRASSVLSERSPRRSSSRPTPLAQLVVLDAGHSKPSLVHCRVQIAVNVVLGGGFGVRAAAYAKHGLLGQTAP